MKKILALFTAAALTLSLIPVQSVYAAGEPTKIKVSEAAFVGNLDAQHGSVITLEEPEKDSWSKSESFTLRLPDGIMWNTKTRVNGRLVDPRNIKNRDLTVVASTTEKIDTLVIDTFYNVDRNVDLGDIRALFVRGNISQDDTYVTLGTVKDYGVKLTANDSRDIGYGDMTSKQVTIQIEEFVEGSLVRNSGYELLLKNADFDTKTAPVVTTIAGSKKLEPFFKNDALVFVSPEGQGKGKWEIKFNMIPKNSYKGEIELSLNGRDVDDKVVLAAVVNDISVSEITPVNIALGYNEQSIGQIKIMESQQGAIMAGTHGVLIDPVYKGLKIEDARLNVTEGNIKVRNFRYGDGMFLFDVSDASTKTSEITIDNIKIAIDQFGYEGQYKGKLVLNYNKPSQTEVQEFVLFNAAVSKPVEGAEAFVGRFTIGNPSFIITTNGISRTELFDTAPYIKDSRTMLSVKAAGIALNADVVYNADKKEITVKSGDNMAVMVIGSNKLMINSKEVMMDTAAEINNSRTFIPLVYLTDVFGAEVSWDAATKSVTLTRK